MTLAHTGAKLIGGISSALIDNPKENAPKVLAAFLGFYAGSGGTDGNGGIPDLDLFAGIDAHRSILTHSILAGVVAEGVLLAAADLAVLVQDNPPDSRDPIWEKLANAALPLKQSLIAGTSAGVAYHLLVDAGIQPAAYHGLPFEMPMEAHQGVMGANALAEARYAAEYRRRKGETVAEFNYRQLANKKTAGQEKLEKSLELAAEKVTRNVKTVGTLGKSLLDGFKKGYSGND